MAKSFLVNSSLCFVLRLPFCSVHISFRIIMHYVTCKPSVLPQVHAACSWKQNTDVYGQCTADMLAHKIYDIMLLVGKYYVVEVTQHRRCPEIIHILFTEFVIPMCIYNSILLMHQILCFDTRKCCLGFDFFCVLSHPIISFG